MAITSPLTTPLMVAAKSLSKALSLGKQTVVGPDSVEGSDILSKSSPVDCFEVATNPSYSLTSDSTALSQKLHGQSLSLSGDQPRPISRHEYSDPLLQRGSPVIVEPGEDWHSALWRHYGKELPDVLVERIANAHESKSTGTPSQRIIAPSLEGIYHSVYGGRETRGRTIVERSDVVIISDGQTLADAIQDHYRRSGNLDGNALDADFLRVASMAVEVVNGGSRYTGKPLVVAMPNVDDLAKLMEHMLSEITRMGARRDHWSQQQVLEGGDGSNSKLITPPPGPGITEIALSGKSYQPEFGEKLNDVAAYVYRDYLTRGGLSFIEAEKELQEIMLGVMRWNKMATLDIGSVPVMYWPTISQLNRFRSHPRVRAEAGRFKEKASHLWQAIVAASIDAQKNAEVAKSIVVNVHGSTQDQLRAVESASGTAFMMQLEQKWTKSDLVQMPHFGPLWYDEDFIDDEVYAGELAARKPNEALEVYALRLFNGTLEPYELHEFAKRSEFLVAVHLKMMNRNGDMEPGAQERLSSGLQELGLMDGTGQIVLDEGLSPAAIDVKTVEITNKLLHAQMERAAGEPIDAFLERANWQVEPAQMGAIKQLWLWNAMAKRGIDSVDSLQAEFNVPNGVFCSYEDPHMADMLSVDEIIAQLMEAPNAAEGWDCFDLSDAQSESDTEISRLMQQTRRHLIEDGFRFDRLSDAQSEKYRESFEEMLMHLQEFKRENHEFHEKLIIASRVIANRILNGEPLGAPLSWFS